MRRARSRLSVTTCDDPSHRILVDRVLADSVLSDYVAKVVKGHVEIRHRPGHEQQLSIIRSVVELAVSDPKAVCKR